MYRRPIGRGLCAVIAIAGLHGLGAQTTAGSPASAPKATKTTVLVGGMLLTGYEVHPPLHRAAVVIEGNRIAWVGAAADASIPAGATVIDTSGRTMLPGLLDLHVHTMLLGHGDYARWFPWLAEHGVDRVMRVSARQLLDAGVTTAVDLAGPLQESLALRDRINRGEIPGPRMMMSGPWITLSRGPFAIDFQRVVGTPDEAYAETEKLAKAGVDLIKAYPMSREHYAKVVEAAHKYKVKVHAHVHEESLVRDALAGGVDILTHAGGANTPAYSEDLIREIVNSGRPVVLTAARTSWIYPATMAFPERLEDPQLEEDFPPDVWRSVQDSFRDWRTLGYFQRADRDVLFRERGVKQFIEAGAVMGMGTDSGTPMNFHTEALWREIKAHVEMGMSPLRAISAATRVNARIVGRGNDLGTIEPGKLADIIVVKGDPLFDILALSRVELVVKDGVVVKDAR